MRIRALATAAFLATLPASSLHAQEAVTLNFGWTPGSAAVTQTSTVSVTAAGQGSEMGNEMSYRMVVSGAGEDFRISYTDFVVDGKTMEEVMADPQASAEAAQAMAAGQADIIVGRDGSFVRLADYAALRAAMEEAMAPMREQMAAQGMAGMMDDVLESTLSEETVTQAAELNWNQVAGYWAGRTLRAGEPQTVRTTTVLPLGGAQILEVDTELTLVGRTACAEGGAADGCLELATRSHPDDEELRNLMDVFMADILERSGGTGMEMGITGMTMTSVSTLVVEAETLRPVRMETTVEMSMRMDIMGMTQDTENRQVNVTRWDWGN